MRNVKKEKGKKEADHLLEMIRSGREEEEGGYKYIWQ